MGSPISGTTWDKQKRNSNATNRVTRANGSSTFTNNNTIRTARASNTATTAELRPQQSIQNNKNTEWRYKQEPQNKLMDEQKSKMAMTSKGSSLQQEKKQQQAGQLPQCPWEQQRAAQKAKLTDRALSDTNRNNSIQQKYAQQITKPTPRFINDTTAQNGLTAQKQGNKSVVADAQTKKARH